MQKSLTLVESLLRFGLNHLSVNYYFAFLSLAQTYSLNRHDFAEASWLESYMLKNLAIDKNRT